MKSLQLLQGHHYGLRMTVVNRAGLSSVQDSPGVTIDTSPPGVSFLVSDDDQFVQLVTKRLKSQVLGVHFSSVPPEESWRSMAFSDESRFPTLRTL